MLENIQEGSPLELKDKTRNELVVELDKINSFIAELSQQKNESTDGTEIVVLDKIISKQKSRYNTLLEEARMAQEIAAKPSESMLDKKYQVWTDDYTNGGGLGNPDNRFIA